MRRPNTAAMLGDSVDGDIIDSHVHVGLPKFPAFDQYRRFAKVAGVTGAVLTQHMGEVNNDHLVACANLDPANFAVVGMVDLDSPRASEVIADAAADPIFRGIRLLASSRGRGDNPLEIWHTLARLGLVASVRGSIADTTHPSFIEILEEFPELLVRIDHFGLFGYGYDPTEDFERLMSLSRFEKVHLMWAGFHAYSSMPFPYRDSHRFLRASLESFGADRIMWSGDWARSGTTEPLDYYPMETRLVQSELDFVTDQERRAILSGTARRVFGLSTSVTPL